MICEKILSSEFFNSEEANQLAQCLKPDVLINILLNYVRREGNRKRKIKDRRAHLSDNWIE